MEDGVPSLGKDDHFVAVLLHELPAPALPAHWLVTHRSLLSLIQQFSMSFMITNDSVTVAAEVPIYLTRKVVTYFRIQHGLKISFDLEQTLSGHIDLVQIRNGSIHILDYKPNAAKEKPIQQLMSYALALASRTNLRLYHFTCTWFTQVKLSASPPCR